METGNSEPTIQQYLALGIVAAGLSVPLGVYMLLRDASNDVRLVLAGGIVFGGFAILYRLIESRVQIAKERAEAYRDAVAIARELYRAQMPPVDGGPRFLASAAEFERQVWGERSD